MPQPQEIRTVDVSDWKKAPTRAAVIRKYAHDVDTAAKGMRVTKAGTGKGVVVAGFPISSEAVDRDGDTISLKGWHFEHYNGVVLFGHARHAPPVAKSAAPYVSGRYLMADPEFTPRDMYDFGGMIGDMVAGRFLRSSSVGMKPMEWEENEDDGRANQWGNPAFDFKEQELLEWSVVPVPSNWEATLDQAKSAGIDVLPMVEFAEKTLALARNKSLIPAPQLERIVRRLTGGRVTVVGKDPASTPDPADTAAAACAGAEAKSAAAKKATTAAESATTSAASAGTFEAHDKAEDAHGDAAKANVDAAVAYETAAQRVREAAIREQDLDVRATAHDRAADYLRQAADHRRAASYHQDRSLYHRGEASRVSGTAGKPEDMVSGAEQAGKPVTQVQPGQTPKDAAVVDKAWSEATRQAAADARRSSRNASWASDSAHDSGKDAEDATARAGRTGSDSAHAAAGDAHANAADAHDRASAAHSQAAQAHRAAADAHDADAKNAERMGNKDEADQHRAEAASHRAQAEVHAGQAANHQVQRLMQNSAASRHYGKGASSGTYKENKTMARIRLSGLTADDTAKVKAALDALAIKVEVKDDDDDDDEGDSNSPGASDLPPMVKAVAKAWSQSLKDFQDTHGKFKDAMDDFSDGFKGHKDAMYDLHGSYKGTHKDFSDSVKDLDAAIGSMKDDEDGRDDQVNPADGANANTTGAGGTALPGKWLVTLPVSKTQKDVERALTRAGMTEARVQQAKGGVSHALSAAQFGRVKTARKSLAAAMAAHTASLESDDIGDLDPEGRPADVAGTPPAPDAPPPPANTAREVTVEELASILDASAKRIAESTEQQLYNARKRLMGKAV